MIKSFLGIFLIGCSLIASTTGYGDIEVNLYSKAGSSNLSFTCGVDISALPEIEDNGGKYYVNGTKNDPLQIFKDQGINYARLRLWKEPVNEYCNLEKTISLAQRVRNKGLKLLLNFHYSDTWADPGHQLKPVSWNGLSFDELRIEVYNYTKEVISTLKNNDGLPSMVQIGNEISTGMLWDDGRVGGEHNNNWFNFTVLLKAGISGVQDSLTEGEEVKIMIHIDRGGDNEGSKWFIDNLLYYGVDFDIIGLSYYPWWHGTLEDLENNINDLSERYGKEIIIVETAYPWTLDYFDLENNIVGLEEQLHEGYPATIEGQEKYLEQLINIIKGVQNSKGMGMFYWAPEWISLPSLTSPWENVALFDFNGNVLDSLSAFRSANGKSSTIEECSTIETESTETTLSTSAMGIFIAILAMVGFHRNRKKQDD
ncbi:MAG: glycoside hydrolase family 53 protein [Candidatus Hodarchaeales archaeon]|jgi:arabinogalactan endo-1,4-beta-galactosidase